MILKLVKLMNSRLNQIGPRYKMNKYKHNWKLMVQYNISNQYKKVYHSRWYIKTIKWKNLNINSKSHIKETNHYSN